jgi:hypothetical protein
MKQIYRINDMKTNLRKSENPCILNTYSDFCIVLSLVKLLAREFFPLISTLNAMISYLYRSVKSRAHGM